MSYLLENGVKIAMVYGDRDYACNWIGGEAVSLAITYTNTADFRLAGYTNITTNSSYVGGLVRQYGNFSFSRIFQAGHEVPAYQPETAYKIFMRSLFNKDIATGETTLTDDYATKGMASTWSVKNAVPKSEQPFCYTYALSSTCTDEQLQSVIDGTALIQDYIVIDNYTSQLFPEIAAQANSSNPQGAGGNGTSGDGSSSGGSSSGSDDSGSQGSGNVATTAAPSMLLLLAAIALVLSTL